MVESRSKKNLEMAKEIESEERKEKSKKVVKIFLKIFIPVFSFVLISYILLRFVGNMGIVVREYAVYNDNLPDDFNGLKIVQFSDLHYNENTSFNSIKSLVELINETNPDIVIFTGDLINKDFYIKSDLKEDMMKEFNNINARIGKYAIKGEEDGDDFKDIFDNSGFIILENEIENVFINSSIINLIALDKTYSFSDIEGNNTDYYSIALIHEPDLADRIVNDFNPELILAGHSHNGQIILPFIGPILMKKDSKKYVSSYYKIDNTDLYVSGGLGNSTYEFRLFNHPSINFYRLRTNK